MINLWQWDYKVFVVKNDNTVESRSVKIWEQNSEWVEIISWLKEGEKIVITGTLDLQDGDFVEELK